MAGPENAGADNIVEIEEREGTASRHKVAVPDGNPLHAALQKMLPELTGEWWLEKESESAQQNLSKALRGYGERRSLWLDAWLKFWEMDRIPQHLIRAHIPVLEMVNLSEPWLRAFITAQQQDLPEEVAFVITYVLQYQPARWYMAWVAAENGHDSLVLSLLLSIKEKPDELFDDFCPPCIHRYTIWKFLMEKGHLTDDSKVELEYGILKETEGDDWSFLHYAAARGDLTCVEKLLTDGGVDHCTRQGHYTALHLAAYHDKAAVVNLLLMQDSARVDVTDERKRTPLHHASEQGCLASVRALLEHAKDNIEPFVRMTDVNGMTALHLAACQGQTQVVWEFLLRTEQCPSLMSLRSGEDLTSEKAFIAHSLDRWREKTPDRGWEWLEAHRKTDPSTSLRPNHLDTSGVVWSPGGFSALHFAVVYGNNIDTIREILQHGEREALSTIKDSLGLTPADWAEVVDLEEACREIMGNNIRRQGPNSDRNSCQNVTNYKQAKWHYRVVKEAEEERRRLQWIIEIGEALVGRDWDDVKRLTSEGVQQKFKVDDSVWKHLKWAINKALWLRVKNIERMLVELVEGEAFSSNMPTLQNCLMWAIEEDMVDVVEAIVKQDGKNKCELLSVARGCHHEKSPLQAATDKGERGSRLVAAMEQREDVQRRLYEDRQVYVDYANTILVGAVLIAALAYQGWVQQPQGYAAMPLNSNCKGMRVFARCNSLGFFFSMGAVMAAAVAAMPLRSGQLVKFREKSTRAGTVASVLMAASVTCEVVGFAVAVACVESHHDEKSMEGLASISTVIVLMLAAWFIDRANQLHPFLEFLRMFPEFLRMFLRRKLRMFLEFLRMFPEFLRMFLRVGRPFQLFIGNPLYLFVFHPLKRCFCADPIKQELTTEPAAPRSGNSAHVSGVLQWRPFQLFLLFVRRLPTQVFLCILNSLSSFEDALTWAEGVEEKVQELKGKVGQRVQTTMTQPLQK